MSDLLSIPLYSPFQGTYLCNSVVNNARKACFRRQICTPPRFPDPSKAHSPAILSSIMPEKPVFTDIFAHHHAFQPPLSTFSCNSVVNNAGKACFHRHICTPPRFPDPSKAHSPAILSSIMPEKPVFADRFALHPALKTLPRHILLQFSRQ